jgi:hypothetical protein
MIALTIWQGPRWRVLALTFVLVGTGLVTLFSDGLFWAGSWRQAVDWGTGSVILGGPLAAGLAAWQYARMRQNPFAEFASATRRGLAAWLAPGLLVWMQASMVVVLCTVIAATTTISLGVPSHWTDLGIVPQAVAVLGADVALGASLGVVTGRLWVAPPAVVITYILGVASGWGLLPGIFDTGGVTGSLAGEEFNGQVILLQGVAALGIAAAAGWAVLSLLAVRSRRIAVVLVIPMLAGAIAYVQLGDIGHERYRYTTEPIRYECAGDSPEVCLVRETPRPLKALEREFARQAAILEPLGFKVPDRFLQSLPGITYQSDVGVILFYDNAEGKAEADPYSVSRSLGVPHDCPEYSADIPNENALNVSMVVMAWIADRTGTNRVDPYSRTGRWMASDEGLAWARRAYRKLSSCNFDGLSAPPIDRW